MRDEVDRLSRQISELETQLRRGVNTNSSTIQVNAGGVGVWIATTACAVMLGLSVFAAMIIMDQNRRIGELNAYLSAIYAQAPYLKPEEDQ